MNITIKTSPQNVEMANYILAQAIKSLEANPKILDLTPQEVEAAARFRRSLLKGFLHPDKS